MANDMRSYPVPEWLRSDLGAASLRLESVERVALTASGNAAEWADRVIGHEHNSLVAALAACGCGGPDDTRQYYGVLDPEYPEPLVIAVVSLDEAGQLRRWNDESWEDVPAEMEPQGYPFVGLEGSMLIDALRASGGLLLRPTAPKAKVSGPLVAAGSTPGGKHFALVDDFDTSAVLELVEMRPGPRVFTRSDGEWVENGAILGRLRSVDPPKAVVVADDQLEAVIRQVDEFDRANADKQETIEASGLVAAMAREAGGGGARPKPRPKPVRKPGIGQGVSNAVGGIAKSIGTGSKKTGQAARRRGLRPAQRRRRRSGDGEWDESKFNRVDGKFAAKGAADDHSNDGGKKRRGAGRGRSSAVGSRGKAAGRKRVRVSQSTVDELNRHSMAENIAKANSGKASPEFVEAARRFYPGKIKGTAAGTGSTGVKTKGGAAAKGKAKKTAKGKAGTKSAKAKAIRDARRKAKAAEKAKNTAVKTKAQAAKDRAAAVVAAREKAERVNNARWEVRRAKADLGEQRRRGQFNDAIQKFYQGFKPGDDRASDQLAEWNRMIQEEQGRREAYDRAADYEAQTEAIRRLERRIKLGLVASVGVRPIIAVAEHSTMPSKLKGYWSRGEGAAKIRWGTGGDFDRCRKQLSKYLRPDQVAGACANLHKAATGTWPGKGRGHTASVVTAGGYEGNGAMIALTPPIEVAQRLVERVNDGNPADEIHVTLAYLGEDVDDEVVKVAAEIAEAITLEYNTIPAHLGGRGQFLNDETANYVSVDAPGIEGFWADLTERLQRAGVPLPTEHGFTPHITLAYGDLADDEWPSLPLRTELGTITVRHGGNTVGSWELLP